MLNVYCNPCTSVNTTWNLNKQNTMLIHIAYNLNWKFECSLYQAFGRKRKYIPSCLHTPLLQVEFVSAPIKRSHALLEGVAFPWGHWSAMIRSPNYVFFCCCCCFLLEAKHPQVTIWIYFWTFRHSKWAVARCSIYVNNVYLQVPICTIKCTCNYNAYISVMMSKTSQYAILHEYEYLPISEFMYEHVWNVLASNYAL